MDWNHWISIKITVVIRCQKDLEDDGDKNNKDEYEKERERQSRRIRGSYPQRKSVGGRGHVHTIQRLIIF